MWYVYIIRSINFPDQEYTGASEEPKQRLADHNAGRSTHAAKFKPWKLVWYCAFPDNTKRSNSRNISNLIPAAHLQKSASANLTSP
jgi:putative endonuclease